MYIAMVLVPFLFKEITVLRASVIRALEFQDFSVVPSGEALVTTTVSVQMDAGCPARIPSR